MVNVMDYYSLEEVKKIIDNNLLTPEVLRNILKSTTRRIEIKDDLAALDILKFLSKCSIIPEDTRNYIDKYLSEHDSYILKGQKNDEENNSTRRTILLYLLIISILAFIIFLVVKGVFYA